MTTRIFVGMFKEGKEKRQGYVWALEGGYDHRHYIFSSEESERLLDRHETCAREIAKEMIGKNFRNFEIVNGKVFDYSMEEYVDCEEMGEEDLEIFRKGLEGALGR